MSAWITTDRGRVRVIAPECARRPCLHVHWSRFASTTDEVTRGPFRGAERKTFPLVCIRNESYGCPHPLPDPEPKP